MYGISSINKNFDINFWARNKFTSEGIVILFVT